LVEAVQSDASGPDGVVVAELSSFQLERVQRFRADVAVLLNVSPDHLDRYDSFEDYARTKGRVFAGQGPDDAAVIPYGDDYCRGLAEAGGGQVHEFGGEMGGVRVVGELLVNGSSAFSFPLADLRIRGAHNYQNACAAVVAARAAGAPVAAIQRALAAFAGLPHRAQWVRERSGVTYYDDSKATNVGAAVASVEGMQDGHGRLVVIAGGRHKGGSYSPLRQALESAGGALVLLGEATNLIEEAFLGSEVSVQRAETMSEAVDFCARLAGPGDGVILAPACSSFDMYTSYAARGDDYQREVHRLSEDES
jgi:UDP-N-acetylmuramoylalanine--D-glutamate ligase